MKAIAILGSRDPEGRTARATEALMQGLTDDGVEADIVFLTDHEIERCRQCENNGWGICLEKGQCIIEDDFASLADRIRDADVAVFATPVYFSDLSEGLRAFLDRLRRTSRHEDGRQGIEGKPAVGLCVAGGGGGGAPACAVSLEKVVSSCGFDVVDMVPARRQNLDLKQVVLTVTGKWLAGYVRSERSS